MTLDEAIKHAEEVAEANEDKVQIWHKTTKNRLVDFCDKALQEENNCMKCAEEHRQLAEWLKELKEYKGKTEPKPVIYSGDGYADGYMVYDYAECPNCGREFEDGRDEWNMPYCCACGQALKWESEVPE